MTERFGWVLALGLLFGCRTAPRHAFVDLEGLAQHPLDASGAVANVLLFSTVDCPIANTYAPTIVALADEFGPRGFRFFLVHVDPDTDRSRAAEHARDFSYTIPVVLDPEHELVEWAGATITPEVAVITPRGDLAYRGRIDDGYAALGKKRPRPTRHDLRAALSALAESAPIPVPRTEPVGCFIPAR